MAGRPVRSVQGAEKLAGRRLTRAQSERLVVFSAQLRGEGPPSAKSHWSRRATSPASSRFRYLICTTLYAIAQKVYRQIWPEIPGRAGSQAPPGIRSCKFASAIPTTQPAVASIAQTWPSMGVGAAVMMEAPHLRKHALRLMGSQRVSRAAARRSFSPSTPAAR
jgi:hypothetical protein